MTQRKQKRSYQAFIPIKVVESLFEFHNTLFSPFRGNLQILQLEAVVIWSKPFYTLAYNYFSLLD